MSEATATRFAPMREAKAESIEQALDLLKKDFTYTTRPVVINDLSMTEDYKVSIGQDRLPITRWGFDNLMTTLHIPASFGEYIPNDLLQTVVSRLKGIDPFGVKLFVDKEGTLINVKKGNYVAPKIENILGHMKGDIKVGRVSAMGVRFITLLPDALVEPEKGDKMQVGTILTASETGGMLPLAKLATIRFICTNGAIVADDIGIVRYTNKKDEGGIDSFLNGMRELDDRAESIILSLTNLPKRQLTDADFSKLWNQVRRFFDAEETDKIFETEAEARKVYLATSTMHKHLHEAAGATDVNAWKVFNNITAKAKELDYGKNGALMGVGGSILSMN